MRNRFEEFTVTILRLSRSLQRLRDGEMEKYGLRGKHVMCLYYLGCHPEGLTAVQLTALCEEDKAAVSRTLAALVERGFVSSETAEGRRSYRSLHFLTDEGRATSKALNRSIAAALNYGGHGLTYEQWRNFCITVDRINNNLSQYIEDKDAGRPAGACNETENEAEKEE